MLFLPMRRLGPVGLAFAAYRVWRRLSPRQRAAIRAKAADLMAKRRGGGAVQRASAERTVSAAGVRHAAAPEPLTVDDLTSPGTVADPALEQQRAEQALVRERESRASEETKFEELRREQGADAPPIG